MKELPIGARVYVAAVIACGSGLLAYAAATARIDEPARFLLFLLLSGLGSVLKVSVPMPRGLAQHGLTMSLSFVMNFAALLVLGMREAMLIAAVGAWSQCTFNVRQRNPPHRTAFSVAAIAITFLATGWMYTLDGGSRANRASPEEAVSLAAAACMHFFVNSGLIAGAIALSARQPFAHVWSQHFVTGWVNQLLGALAGVLLARGVHQTHYWLVPITVLLLALTWRTYRAYHARIEAEQRAVQQMSDLHQATLEALALAIDAKGQDSRTHLRRVQTCSEALARAEGLADEEVQAIRTAALLHDIGLLAVPQHILSKTGRLSGEEQRKLHIHPRVGAEIIRDVPFPSPVAPIIAAHHEWWDGTGYPNGLNGEAIPLGARILAIADRFDAILRERRDVGPDEAASLLRTEAGHQLDPRLVARFVRLLPQLAVEIVDARAASVPSSSVLPFENIALAHREVHTLYEIAQALSPCLSVVDAMRQLTARLDALVPCSTSALFLRDDERGQLVCRSAAGPGAPTLDPMRVPIGAGPVGWVVEHQRALVNVSLTVTGDASVDDQEIGALRSALICPLLADGGCLGALVVAHREAGCYHDEHRRILEQVAGHLAAAIQNALRFERTHEAALTDRLTGLTNSRGLASAFDGALAHAMAHGEPLAVLMIDVDDFKAINDTHGHAAGDRALRETARVLAHSIRARDVCARYAGDEFVLILRSCGSAEAERRAKELQMMFEAVRFAPDDGGLRPLHISVGAASFPADGSSLEGLLVVADRQMYKDKSQRKRARAAAAVARQVECQGE